MTYRIPRLMCILTIAALTFAGGFGSAMAQDSAPVIGDGPNSAAAPLGDWVTLQNGETHWYTFTEGGGEKDVEVRMALSQNDKADFEVWTSDNLREWQNGSEFDPVGAGTANENLNDDLYWKGRFVSGDTYYVIVKSRNFGPIDYWLTISGRDVGFPSAAVMMEQTTEETATEETAEEVEMTDEAETVEIEEAEVEATAVEAVEVESVDVVVEETEEASTEESATESEMTGESSASDDVTLGTHAGVALDPIGETKLLNPGDTHWYAFREEGDGATVQAILNASPQVGIYFEVWNAEQFRKWQAGEDFDPVGAGTKNTAANIDLHWRGSFVSSSDYYVVVRHTGAVNDAIEYSLTVTGDDVSY